jgi:hypothetical protein
VRPIVTNLEPLAGAFEVTRFARKIRQGSIHAPVNGNAGRLFKMAQPDSHFRLPSAVARAGVLAAIR